MGFYDSAMPIIRPAQPADLPAILEIYNEAVVATTASWAIEPVTLADRQAWLARQSAADHPVLTVEEDGCVVGFASYGPFRPQGGYAQTVEHSIYIKSGHRAAGLGRLLLGTLIDSARSNGVHAMVGVIDGANAESVAFHERMGFQVSGRLPEVGRKFGRWLDVVFVTRILA